MPSSRRPPSAVGKPSFAYFSVDYLLDDVCRPVSQHTFPIFCNVSRKVRRPWPEPPESKESGRLVCLASTEIEFLDIVLAGNQFWLLKWAFCGPPNNLGDQISGNITVIQDSTHPRRRQPAQQLPLCGVLNSNCEHGPARTGHGLAVETTGIGSGRQGFSTGVLCVAWGPSAQHVCPYAAALSDDEDASYVDHVDQPAGHP
ncbi:hypothetical protein THAOC_33151, partial [Thalassiosira oceanica]